MNLTELINQWIEGSIHYTDEMLEDNNKRREYEAGINDFYNDLKQRTPELIESIVKEIQKMPQATRDESQNEKTICEYDIINHLTK